MSVMTGSSITSKFSAPGDRVRLAIDGLGAATLEMAGAGLQSVLACSWSRQYLDDSEPMLPPGQRRIVSTPRAF
jgi:hypothetical protein